MSPRRKYSKELKREAVRVADTPGVTLKLIAEELGINAHLLGKWRKQLREDDESNAFPGQGNARDEEMAALKCELARVKNERDFLREAVFFAKESK